LAYLDYQFGLSRQGTNQRWDIDRGRRAARDLSDRTQNESEFRPTRLCLRFREQVAHFSSFGEWSGRADLMVSRKEL
jgi:hypothetical protein